MHYTFISLEIRVAQRLVAVANQIAVFAAKSVLRTPKCTNKCMRCVTHLTAFDLVILEHCCEKFSACEICGLGPPGTEHKDFMCKNSRFCKVALSWRKPRNRRQASQCLC